MQEPETLSISDLFLATGPTGWLILVLVVPAGALALCGFWGRSARLPLLSLALCVAMFLLGLLGTSGGLIGALFSFEPGPDGGLTRETAMGLAYSFLPLMFGVLLSGPIAVLSIVCIAFKATRASEPSPTSD